MRLFRLIKIVYVVLRFGLDEFLLAHARVRWLRVPLNMLLFLRNTSKPRAVRLRLALENLGPIFVKFGQMLSTRRDLMPADLADELAMLRRTCPRRRRSTGPKKTLYSRSRNMSPYSCSKWIRCATMSRDWSNVSTA